jgi:hypothetical protein
LKNARRSYIGSSIARTPLESPVEPGWQASKGPPARSKAEAYITLRSAAQTPEKHWGKCAISPPNLTLWLFCKVGGVVKTRDLAALLRLMPPSYRVALARILLAGVGDVNDYWTQH